MRRTKRLAMALSAAAAAIVATAVASPAWGHGYTSGPPSRAALCADGTVADCGDIQWEPHSVEGPKGFPEAGPADGEICAGGNGRFSQLDEPRDWPATDVSAGTRTFTWTITAAHSTDKWDYYVTKDGWNPDQPLTRDQLDLTPVTTVHDNGAQPDWTVNHDVTLPDKSGHHLVLAVWTVADTANAFYSCTDVNFGGSGGTDPGDPGENGCASFAWSAASAYNGGAVVTHGGDEWRAKWWTQGEEPGASASGVWEHVRAC